MLIRNGTVHDGLGSNGILDIRVREGRIWELGKLVPEAGEEVMEAQGMTVFPGFIQTVSHWGVNGSMQEIRPSSDDNDEKSDPVTPHLDAFYAFNGRAATAQQLGAFGLTACGVAPTDNNLFGGKMAVFTVDGVNPCRMALGRNTAMMGSVTASLKTAHKARQAAPQTRMWIFTNLKENLRRAAAYESQEGKPEDEKLAAIREVTEGRIPFFVCCDSLAAAERVWEITSEYPSLRLVLVNGFGLTGEETWIREHKIPVVVRTPANPLDEYGMKLNLEAVASLAEQGVPVALSGTATNYVAAREDVLWNGIEMMKVVHDCEKVLPMITSTPARLLGLGEETGSIGKGLRADLTIWSDNPLCTYQARVIRTLAGGRTIYREGDELRCM